MLTLRPPAYVGAGGLGAAILSSLPPGLSSPFVAPVYASPAPAEGPALPARGSLWDPAPLPDGWSPAYLLLLSAGLGDFLLIFSFLLGVIVGGSGGFLLGYLWGAWRRQSSQHYAWP